MIYNIQKMLSSICFCMDRSHIDEPAGSHTQGDGKPFSERAVRSCNSCIPTVIEYESCIGSLDPSQETGVMQAGEGQYEIPNDLVEEVMPGR